MGNLKTGPKDWPIYWVLVVESTNWTGAGVYTSEAAVVKEAMRLIEWELDEGLGEDLRPETVRKLRGLLRRGDISELLDYWHAVLGSTRIIIEPIVQNSPIDPEEWFTGESYSERKRKR
jgi:hypothetical protein